MNHYIQFAVTIERHEASGACVARCADFPGKTGVGATEEEAVAHLRARMPAPPPSGRSPLPRPASPGISPPCPSRMTS